MNATSTADQDVHRQQPNQNDGTLGCDATLLSGLWSLPRVGYWQPPIGNRVAGTAAGPDLDPPVTPATSYRRSGTGAPQAPGMIPPAADEFRGPAHTRHQLLPIEHQGTGVAAGLRPRSTSWRCELQTSGLLTPMRPVSITT